MGHTQAHHLKDLKNELDAIRGFEGIKEKSPGIFYFKSIPFLHFHDKDGHRWADVKIDGVFSSVDIPFDANSVARKTFLKKISSAHEKLSLKSKGKKK